MIRRVAVCFSVLCLSGLSACSDDDTLPAQGGKKFISACVAKSEEFSRATGIRAGRIATFVHWAAVKPTYRDIGMDFRVSADDIYKPAGQREFSHARPEAECAAAAEHAEDFEGMAFGTVVQAGAANELSALDAQIESVGDVAIDLKERQAQYQESVERIRKILLEYAPKGGQFRVLTLGDKRVPSITMSAVNAVGRPIEAFYLRVRLVGPDGKDLAGGKIAFKPPVPLAVGSQADYTLNLEGINGVDTDEVLNSTAPIRPVIGLDDLIVEGKPILDLQSVTETDRSRADFARVFLMEVAVYRGGIQADLDQIRMALASKKS